MNKPSKEVSVIIILALIWILSLPTIWVITIPRRKFVAERRQYLTSSGVTIIHGEVESPSVVITVHTFAQFLDVLREQNTTTVYQTPQGYWYVFRLDYQVAWRFLPWWDIKEGV